MKTIHLTAFLTTILICNLTGCFYAKVPEFKLPEIRTVPVAQAVEKDCPKAEPEECIYQEERSCIRVAMPNPIPKEVELVVKGGKVIKANKGGEELIRQYAGTRKAIKKQWQED